MPNSGWGQVGLSKPALSQSLQEIYQIPTDILSFLSLTSQIRPHRSNDVNLLMLSNPFGLFLVAIGICRSPSTLETARAYVTSGGGLPLLLPIWSGHQGVRARSIV